MRLVDSSAPRDSALFYGPPCMPPVSGCLWECNDRAEYIDLLSAYEASEKNCNTCRHLRRTKHPKQPDGFLFGVCGAIGGALKFHPHDPMWLENEVCWESRRDQS